MKERGNEKAYSIINVTKVNIHEYITFPNRDIKASQFMVSTREETSRSNLYHWQNHVLTNKKAFLQPQLVSRELKVRHHKEVKCTASGHWYIFSYVQLLILFLSKVPVTFPCTYVLILTLGHVSAMGLFLYRSPHSRLQNAVSGLREREVTRMNLKIRTYSIRHVITIVQQITQGNCFDAWPSSHRSME